MLDNGFTIIDACHPLRIYIKSYDLETGPGRGQRKGKTDISETNNAKDSFFLSIICKKRLHPGR